MPDKKPDQLLGPLIDTTPRASVPLASQLLPQEIEDLVRGAVQSEGLAALSSTRAERALRDAQIALYDYESEHPSEQARLAKLLLQAAGVLVRQAQAGEASRETGKLKNGVKEYLKHHGESFLDDNLAGHIRRLVDAVEQVTTYVQSGTIEAIQRELASARVSVLKGEILLESCTTPHLKQEIDQTLKQARETIGALVVLAEDIETKSSFAAHFSAQAIRTLWEAGGAWLLEKKMKEQGQRLVMPSVESLAQRLEERFERTPKKRWGALAEDLLFDAVRLAGADAKSARTLVRDPLKKPKGKP